MPMFTAYRNFFLFLFFSMYVGFVPVSDVLAIFISDWRCEFWQKLWFMTEKKTSFGRKFWEAPWSAETKHVLVNPKRFTKTFDSWLLPQYCWVVNFANLLFGK